MKDTPNPENISVGEALIRARRLLSSHPQQAADQARYVIQAEPGIAEAHLLLAIALRVSGELDEAQAAEERAIDCAQKDPVIARVTHHITAREYAAADRLLGLYLTDTPNDPVAIHLRGRIQLVIGQTDEAARLFRRSLALAPSFAPARTELDALAARAGESSSANMASAGLGAEPSRILDEEPWFTSNWDPNSASDQDGSSDS